MAKTEVDRDNNPAAASADDGWTEVKVGIGEAWDWNKNDTLIGMFTGATVVKLPEPREGDGATETTAYEFRLENGDTVFAWESYKLRNALENVGVGDMVKIVYGGKREIAGGSQTMRDYRVWRRESTPQEKIDFGEDIPF